MSLGREEGQTPAGPHNCSGAAFVYFEAQTLVKDAAREPGRRFPSENEARLSRVSRASIVFVSAVTAGRVSPRLMFSFRCS